MKKRTFTLLSLCLMLACTCVFTGCKNTEGATPDEAVTSPTQISTAETAVDTTAQSATIESTAQSTEAEYHTDTVQGRPADREESVKTATVNVGGNDYTVNVGDSIIYTCYLKTPKKIENIQATLTYGNTVLRLKEASSEEMFPKFNSIVYNANISGTLLFNASNPVGGFDFTEKGVVVHLDFDVINEGYTSIATAVEFMDEIGGNPYIENFKIIGNITIDEALS